MITDLLSLPTRGAWIEIRYWGIGKPKKSSLPTRGAWIEISMLPYPRRTSRVAPHAGSVDRNQNVGYISEDGVVSLPTRGAWIEIGHHCRKYKIHHVAPHAGSVDRNLKDVFGVTEGSASLPTQGSWFERNGSNQSRGRIFAGHPSHHEHGWPPVFLGRTRG